MSTAIAKFHGKRKVASAPAGSSGSAVAPLAGLSTGSGVGASARASDRSILEPNAKSEHVLPDLISSASQQRPPGDFGNAGRVFNDREGVDSIW